MKKNRYPRGKNQYAKGFRPNWGNWARENNDPSENLFSQPNQNP
jgi:hypothetical protein